MKLPILVLGLAIVSGQRFQQQSRQPVVSPAVLLASNARIQQQERLFQESQNANIDDQSQFNSGSNLNLQGDLEVQHISDNEFRQPTLRENIGIEKQSTQAQLTLFNGQIQERKSQQAIQNTQFINQNQLSRQSQDSQPIDGVFEPLNLPSGAYLLMGQIDTSFSCADRPYGYYADQGNDCRVFHVCNPYLFDDGRVETQQYSFMCNEHTVFDQKELTCVEQYAASPCEESYLHYSRNEEFGLPEEKN
ncbi:uncharacterized protein LOC143021674 [Oratosquilla oratoria]|uniref:uncharacterized protein LOC143021674 n=1 Tax=Oratosquilla oratoria TaxID=337810 RepID=UPI003F771B9A